MKGKVATRSIAPPTPYRLPDPVAESLLAEQLGVGFDNLLLLRQALTHRSVLNDWQNLRDVSAILQSNERLEFLGDAVLGSIVAERLYRADPQADEGTLTRRRVALVRAETLVQWSRELGVPDCLYLGTGERVTEGARDRMLAGAFEALVGAIYLDRGAAAAEIFVVRFLDRDQELLTASERLQNPKGRLQEVLQEQVQVAPEYLTVSTEGPDHARRFTVAVGVHGVHLGSGRGKSKREAQQAAALEAITMLTDPDLMSEVVTHSRGDAIAEPLALPAIRES